MGGSLWNLIEINRNRAVAFIEDSLTGKNRSTCRDVSFLLRGAKIEFYNGREEYGRFCFDNYACLSGC